MKKVRLPFLVVLLFVCTLLLLTSCLGTEAPSTTTTTTTQNPSNPPSPSTGGGAPDTVVDEQGVKYVKHHAEYWVADTEQTYSANIVLPQALHELPVTAIDDDAFSHCTDLQSITIPSSVTKIGDDVFSHCINLQSIAIPSSITTIGTDAFAHCDNLQYHTYDNAIYLGNTENQYAVLIKANNTNITTCAIHPNTRIIYHKAFQGCTSLNINMIPTNITAIGEWAFAHCDRLQSVIIPSNVKIIDEFSFYHCDSLQSVTISSGVTTIGEWAFAYCNSLQSTIIPSSVSTIDNNAFYDCYALVEVVNRSSLNIAKGKASHGYVAYYAKQVITNQTDSKLIKRDEFVFYHDNGTYYLVDYIGTATVLNLPEDINGNKYSINQGAFYGCSTLKEIIIPSGVTAIGERAFIYCTALESVSFAVGSECTAIDSEAFYGCSKLQGIIVPFGVTKIGDNAFRDCADLASITIPSTVISVGTDAFRGCSSLQYTVYDNAYYLGNSANQYVVLVASDTNVTSVTIHQNTKIIYSNAFSYCRDLQSITLPSGVIEIGYRAFYECNSLQSITIPSSVISIGKDAFYECNNLQYNAYYDYAKYLGNSENPYVVLVKAGDTTISFCNIHADTKIIYHSAFQDCSNLQSITIPTNVTVIGERAFYECNSLQSVTFEAESMCVAIGNMAFYNCDSLQNITIPTNVTLIGTEAFHGCSSLRNLEFEDTTTWYRSAIGYTNGTQTDLIDLAQNANYLKSTYREYYWYKK